MYDKDLFEAYGYQLDETDAQTQKLLKQLEVSPEDIVTLFRLLAAYRRTGLNTVPEFVWNRYESVWLDWIGKNTGRLQLNRDVAKAERTLAPLNIELDGNEDPRGPNQFAASHNNDVKGNRALSFVNGKHLTSLFSGSSQERPWLWGHKGFKLYKPSMNLPQVPNLVANKSRVKGLLGFLTLSYAPDGDSWWRLTDFWRNGNEGRIAAPHFREAYSALKRIFNGYREGHPTA